MDANGIQEDRDNKFEVHESGHYCEEILLKQARQGEEPREQECLIFMRQCKVTERYFGHVVL